MPENRRLPESLYTRGVEWAWLALMRNNVCYLLSALLMLVGCYIVCVPYLFELKIIGGLIELLGAINVYEALVVLTCGFLIRRIPASRESRTLVLVELLFLLDVTFTVNGCLPIHFRWGLILAASSLALALVKIFVLDTGARASIFGGIKTLLMPALFFVYTFQPFLVLFAVPGTMSAPLVTSLIWTAFGALPLLLFGTRLASPLATQEFADLPWWKRRRFQTTVVGITLGVVALQVGGQCWVHRIPLTLHCFAPLAISLFAVLPVFFPNALGRWLDTVRIAATLALLVFGAGVYERSWSLPQIGLNLTPWRINAMFAALISLLLWKREGATAHLDSLYACGMLAFLGHDGTSINEFLRRPDGTTILASLPLLLLWLRHNRNYARVMAVISFQLLLCVRFLYASDPSVDVALQYVRLWPLCAFGCSLLLRQDHRLWKYALLAAMFWLGARSFGYADLASLNYFCVVFLVLAGAAIIGNQLPLPILPAYLFLAATTRRVLPTPDSATHWGWLVIALAFGVFGFAFLVTRRKLQLNEQGLADAASE